MAVLQYPAEWEDISPTGVSVRAGGTNPSVTVWGNGLYAPEFQDNGGSPGTQHYYADVQFWHGCKQGSITVSPHLHCVCAATSVGPANGISFSVGYSYGSIGGVFSAQTTLTATYVPASTIAPLTHLFIETQDVVVTITPSSFMCFDIIRGADSYGASVWLLGFDVHAQMDSRGSQLELSK